MQSELQPKRVTVIGLGYVGLATALGLEQKGHEVVGVDIDERRVAAVNERNLPLGESGFHEALSTVNLHATRDYGAVLDSEITFVCVNTPSNLDGSIDLRCLRQAVETLAEALGKKSHVVVIRSTVVPGTTEQVVLPLLRGCGDGVNVCVNPEFLRAGSALHDFLNPQRIVLGANDGRSLALLESMYEAFGAPIIKTDMRTAEMIKYACNCYLSTRISFMNEIGNICKILGIDVFQVAQAMGYDDRIGNKFLSAGIGFGGPCLPKDINALLGRAADLGYEPVLLKSVVQVNERQPQRVVEMLENKIGNLDGKTVAVLGLAFKSGTDSVCGSLALNIIEWLIGKGSVVKAYDPMAMEAAAVVRADIEYCPSADDALLDADACLLLTEWDEFRSLQFDKMTQKVVIDGRRVLDPERARTICDYEGICW